MFHKSDRTLLKPLGRGWVPLSTRKRETTKLVKRGTVRQQRDRRTVGAKWESDEVWTRRKSGGDGGRGRGTLCGTGEVWVELSPPLVSTLTGPPGGPLPTPKVRGGGTRFDGESESGGPLMSAVPTFPLSSLLLSPPPCEGKSVDKNTG